MSSIALRAQYLNPGAVGSLGLRRTFVNLDSNPRQSFSYDPGTPFHRDQSPREKCGQDATSQWRGQRSGRPPNSHAPLPPDTYTPDRRDTHAP